jgi:arylsulfatase A
VIKDLQPYAGTVRTERWRAVNEGDRWQLYDMLVDPSQERDVAADHPDTVARLSSAYDRWFADVTQRPIVRPPIPVGYAQRPAVELPAPEAYFTGGIGWYNQWGFAHDWLTGWSDPNDTIWWEVDVVTPGRYEVSLMHTCPTEAVGTKLRVEAGRSIVEGMILRAYDPEPRQRPTRHPKKRFVQTFARQPLGEIDLEKGRQRIAIRARSRPADRVCDLKSLWVRRLD